MNDLQACTLKIKGKTYLVEFPNVGKFRTIENIKQALSGGQYGNLLRSGTVDTERALSMIDVEAYISVLAPQLLKDLKVDSFSELGIMDFREIEIEFENTFIPWWNKVMKAISNPDM
jgi:hypothetical protein